MFDLTIIENDIKWHLDVIKDEYKETLGNIEVTKIESDKIFLSAMESNNKLSDVERSGMEDVFLDDYYLFLSKHHPEVKKEQIYLEVPAR